MALIQLTTPPQYGNQGEGGSLQDEVKDTYLDLITGMSGHMPPLGEMEGNRTWNERLLNLPGYEQNAILATGVDSLRLRVATPPEQDFDQITYEHAEALAADGAFRDETVIDQLDGYGAGSCMVIQAGPVGALRYFKGFVRETQYHTNGNPAFVGGQTTLEFEELVENRVIWPIVVNLGRNKLTVENPITQEMTIGLKDEQLLFTLSPEAHGWPEGEGPIRWRPPYKPASEFFNNPFPIAKVVFWEYVRAGTRYIPREIEPKWIESIKISANFSRSYVNSTYLIQLNRKGRPAHRQPDEVRKFSVYLVDRTISIEEWDPTVVVEPQDH